MVAVKQDTFTTSGIDLAGVVCQPTSEPPRGVIVALHGGGYQASYWDGVGIPENSLLRLAAMQGFTAIALDRPGYGSSARTDPGPWTVARQAQLILELISELRDGTANRVPVYVVGHSLGSIVAVQMAADDQQNLIDAIAISGLPVAYPPEMTAGMAALPTDWEFLPAFGEDQIRATFYGPEGTWTADSLRADAAQQSPCPTVEFCEARDYPETFALVAPRVRVPIQYVVAEFEASSIGGEEVLNTSAHTFSSAPRVEAFIQTGAGHSISTHRVAGAYHLRVLAFLDECTALQTAV